MPKREAGVIERSVVEFERKLKARTRFQSQGNEARFWEALREDTYRPLCAYKFSDTKAWEIVVGQMAWHNMQRSKSSCFGSLAKQLRSYSNMGRRMTHARLALTRNGRVVWSSPEIRL